MIDLSRNRAELLAEIEASRAAGEFLTDITGPRFATADVRASVHGYAKRDLFPLLKVVLSERFADVARPELMREAYIQRIIGHHTTPYDCGRVFAQTRPKLAAFTHVVQLASIQIPPPTVAEMIADVRKTYDGPLEMGEDLMSFEIGETVTMKRLMPR